MYEDKIVYIYATKNKTLKDNLIMTVVIITIIFIIVI